MIHHNLESTFQPTKTSSTIVSRKAVSNKPKDLPCDLVHCTQIRGAHVHNLKNIDVELPRNAIDWIIDIGPGAGNGGSGQGHAMIKSTPKRSATIMLGLQCTSEVERFLKPNCGNCRPNRDRIAGRARFLSFFCLAVDRPISHSTS